MYDSNSIARPPQKLGKYVLMTAAYNEECTIENTLHSITHQTVLPEKWIIVSDGSSDGTDKIIQRYARQWNFIAYGRIERHPGRSFGSKVRALRSGSRLLAGTRYEFIGNLDADVTVEPSYFEDLMIRFLRDPQLGLAAGFVREQDRGEFRNRSTNRVYSVAHAAQLVRRECYEAFGGYAVLEYGGEDWHAQTSARMNGWTAKAFPEVPIFHHRRTGEAENPILHRFLQGKMDYSLGVDPLFQLLKCVDLSFERPRILGSIARIAGFLCCYICRNARAVPDEFVTFLRSEQRQRLADIGHLAQQRLRVWRKSGTAEGRSQ